MIKSLFAILPDLLPRSVDEGNAIRSSGMKYLGKMQNLARQALRTDSMENNSFSLQLNILLKKSSKSHMQETWSFCHMCVLQERISALVPDSESPRYLTQ